MTVDSETRDCMANSTGSRRAGDLPLFRRAVSNGEPCEDETRAWTIKIGTKAPQAAGKIHTDFERGFIKAEVINYQQLLDCGSYAAAREKGLVRMEGKDYVVQDGDVILFRFNV